MSARAAGWHCTGRGLILLCCVVLPAAAAPTGDEIVARARATYAALASYSDNGTIDTELNIGAGPTIRERHTFKTYFRAPRHFYFEFNEDRAAGADRFVVWSDEEMFRTWWKTTGIETPYPRGQGEAALVAAFGTTNGAAAIVSPLLFPQASLKGAITNFEQAMLDGQEVVDGRNCHRVKGVQRSVYGTTGRGEFVRGTTLWIDTGTLLVRRIFEDTPRGTTKGAVMRVTTVIAPSANPELESEHFRFLVPQQ